MNQNDDDSPYASEKDRQDWELAFPDMSLPLRQQARFRRNHHLPVRD